MYRKNKEIMLFRTERTFVSVLESVRQAACPAFKTRKS